MIAAVLQTAVYVLSPDRTHVLLMHRDKVSDDVHFGKYLSLGGHVEPGEDVLTCARREVHEESGLTTTDLLFRGTVLWPADGLRHGRAAVLRCDAVRRRRYHFAVADDTFSVTTDAGTITGAAGTGGGPDLLLLHGGPGLSDYMAVLAGETADWRGIHYQQRGLTPSTVDGPYTVARHVADAIAVLDTLGVGQVVVLGHSWGAHLALQVALAAPERVTGVVAVDGLGPSGDGHVPELAAALRARLTPDEAERCALIDGRMAAPDATDADLMASTELLWGSYFAVRADAAPMPAGLRASLACAAGTLGSMLSGELARDAFAGKLANLATPTVVLAGAASPIPVAASEETARLLPHGELVVVPDAGHLPWHERPGCVAEALARVRPA